MTGSFKKKKVIYCNKDFSSSTSQLCCHLACSCPFITQTNIICLCSNPSVMPVINFKARNIQSRFDLQPEFRISVDKADSGSTLKEKTFSGFMADQISRVRFVLFSAVFHEEMLCVQYWKLFSLCVVGISQVAFRRISTFSKNQQNHFKRLEIAQQLSKDLLFFFFKYSHD